MDRDLDLSVGQSRSLILFDNLTRSQIVMYAGASGDYNPLHSDEVYATQAAGHPTTFAHGMLTMGATGRVLTDWVGPERLTAFGVRFVGQVWPGDTLTATATVEGLQEGEDGLIAEFRVATTNQDGATVMSGTASARLGS
jgi:acyl dehydratase